MTVYVGTYEGWADIGEVDGVQFPKGVPVEVDEELAALLREQPDYTVERINKEQAEKASVVPLAEAKEAATRAADNPPQAGNINEKEEVTDGDGSV